MSRGWRIGLTARRGLVGVELRARRCSTRSPAGRPAGRERPRTRPRPTASAAYADLLGAPGTGRPAADDSARVRASTRRTPSSCSIRPTVAPTRRSGSARVRRRAGGRLVAGRRGRGWWARCSRDAPSGRVAGAARPRARAGTGAAGVARFAPRLVARLAGQVGAALLGRDGRIVLAVAAVGGGARAAARRPVAAPEPPARPRRQRCARARARRRRPRGRSTFLESYHGYGRDDRLRRDPGRWWSCVRVCSRLAALADARRAAAASARREQTSRELPPPRREYVESLGARARALARAATRRVAPRPRRRARRLASVPRLPPDAEDEASRAAARRLGFARRRGAALLDPATTDADVLAVGRASRPRSERIDGADDRAAGPPDGRGRQGRRRPGGVVEQLLCRAARRRARPARGRARRREDAARERDRPRARARLPARAVHARHAPLGPDRDDDAARRRARRSGRGRCSRASCSPTRSTARRRRRRRRCSRRCRSGR